MWFEVTSAKVDDVGAGRAVPLDAGATLVFDKSYTDYRWWSKIRSAWGFFVTRRKRNAHCRPISDEAVLGRRHRGRSPGQGRPSPCAWRGVQNPLFDIVLREIPAPAPTRTGSFSAAAVATNWLTPNTVLSRSPFDLGLGRAWQAKRVGALVLHLLIRYWRHRRRQGVP